MILQGLGVVPGLANGQAYRFKTVFDRDVCLESVTATQGADPDREAVRFQVACRQASQELQALQVQVADRLDSDQASLFEVQLLMLDDPRFMDTVCHILSEACVPAETAVRQAASILTASFQRSPDGSLQRYSQDIRDVCRRLVRILSHREPGSGMPGANTIMLADELLPSQVMDLYQIPVTGIILRYGSPVSHASILAKSLGMPLIINLGADLAKIHEQEWLWLNGSDGTIFNYPPVKSVNYPKTGSVTGNRAVDAADEIKPAGPGETAESKTKPELVPAVQNSPFAATRRSDGPIRILVNLNRLEEITPMVKQKAEGVGLFRSEFLCLGQPAWPTEDQQAAIYRRILTEFPEQMVVIRTFDLGTDKTMDLLDLPRELNPVLGYRGVRVSLDRPDIFKVQLRALLRAGQTGHLCILLPMVTTLAEVLQVKILLSDLKQDLVAGGLVMTRKPLLGVMIETPAAALISDQLAAETDYFSIGTNDLIQYTLAADRRSSLILDADTAHHPAVLALIRQVVEQAHLHGLSAGLCGEMAADPDMFSWFCAIGLDELSVSPDRLPEMRKQTDKMQKYTETEQQEE